MDGEISRNGSNGGGGIPATNGQGNTPSRSKSVRGRKKTEITQNPPASDFTITQKLLKVSVLSLTTLDVLKSGVMFKISVLKDGKDVVPPIEAKPEVGECEVHFQNMFSFMLPNDLDLDKAEVKVELTEKKMLRAHKYGGAVVRFHEFVGGGLTDQKNESAIDVDMVPGGRGQLIAKTLTKPESKNNPTNRGTFCCQVELVPMTYKIDLGTFFQRLPHQISGWVIFVKGPDDEWDAEHEKRNKGARAKTVAQSTSPSQRFRTTAAQLLSQGRGEFCFGEAELAELSDIRMGTRVALGLKDTSCGQIVAMSKNNKKLSFLVTELFEHRLTSFVHQFNTESSGMWAQAAEQIRQMNPSAMMDMAGDAEMSDFSQIATMGTLFRDVADSLESGSRELRAEALRQLASNAPHALCSVALQVPFDALVRELDSVIFDAQHKSLLPAASIRNADRRSSNDGRPAAPRTGGVLISPAYGPEAAGDAPKGRISRALSKAGRLLKWSPEEEFEEWGVDPFDDSRFSGAGSLHGSLHGAVAAVHADRTWHGSEITEAMRSSVEYSAVPRHGTVPYPASRSDKPQSMQLREGMLDALQLLSAVLGQRFIESYAMPCITNDKVDREHLAALIGKLYYSAVSSGAAVSSELRGMHISLLREGSEQQRVNAVDALVDIARLETMEAAAHVEECCRILADDVDQISGVHPTLLEAVVMVMPQLFRLPDEDMMHSDVGVRGGMALTHQIQHSKSPQGLQHVSSTLLRSLTSMLSTAIIAFEAGLQPAAVALPRRRNSTEPAAGLMLASGDPAPKLRKSREDNYVHAALALLRAAGKEQWEALYDPWNALLRCPVFRGALGAGLPQLCRQLAVAEGVAAGRLAVPEAQGYLQAALNHCLSTPPAFEGSPTKAEVCLWTWKQMRVTGDRQQAGQAASPFVKLLSQLPSILSAIEEQWADRKKWVRVMHAVYSGYFADRLQVFDDEPWAVDEGKVSVGGEEVKGDYKICDPLALAYQLPAAIRLSKEEAISWPEAIRLHMYMALDEAADIRWMISHSIHLMPALLGEECLDVLCDTFKKLFADDDVDVAEGIVKNYVLFVRAVGALDRDKATPLANDFFDTEPSSWERRLTFQSYRASQMCLLIESGLCADGEARAMTAILNLNKENHSPQVRKCVVREMVEMLRCGRMASRQTELLHALVQMAQTGRCRQRQSFLWACEFAVDRCPRLFNDFLLPALRRMVETRRPGAEGRSLTVGAPDLLARIDAANATPSTQANGYTAPPPSHMASPLSALQTDRETPAPTPRYFPGDSPGHPSSPASGGKHPGRMEALVAAYEEGSPGGRVGSPSRTLGFDSDSTRLQADETKVSSSSSLVREDTPWHIPHLNGLHASSDKAQ